jgi:DNA-directed RNA polymerase specialized sigma24 family protein
MAADRDIELLQDRVLSERARRGDRKAFDELYRRHAPAAWRLALVVTRHPGAAEAAVASAFATTLAGRNGISTMPNTPRVRLLIATRHAAIAAAGDESSARAASGALDLKSSNVSSTAVRQAFDALPERLRSILWLVDVEGCPLAVAEQVLELAPTSAAPLADRARLGLQERVLHADALRPTLAACRRTADSLVGYARGTLTTRDETRVRKHLDGCVGCRDQLAALDDLVPVLRAAALPLPVLMGDEAARRWSDALVRDSGPLHLVLPGGQPVPAWAQRTIAGTVAGVIALGIAGATILAGGRGGRGSGTALPVTSAATLGMDGENALGGLDDLVLDGTGFVPPSTGTAPRGPAAPAASSASGDTARSADALPRSTGSITTPGIPRTPPATPPSAPTQPPAGPTPPPAPPAPPAAEVTVAVPNVVTVTIGDQCTGLALLGTTIGCPPPASDAPPLVNVGGSLLPPITLGL